MWCGRVPLILSHVIEAARTRPTHRVGSLCPRNSILQWRVPRSLQEKVYQRHLKVSSFKRMADRMVPTFPIAKRQRSVQRQIPFIFQLLAETHKSSSHSRLLGTAPPSCPSHCGRDAQGDGDHASHCHHSHDSLQRHPLATGQGLHA